ncbi:patatin-like phospholipase family protein [Segetibacter sp.]|jgi:hypothetical protein|uniref:patatin-like phospholipase family protein n=1 Tax=Segetibacter sp. TaxID=2231182 RepID=UPI00262B56DD|nr:patatin-like phospholipase family protein [Segetibacter sp.]MCW3079968.1 patatin-like phospholipase family protein [Segetibacter sp.]
MPENSSPDQNFYVGLCMAGAVSAGAYTAGVIDYLLEALEEWQKRKDEKVPGTPMHNVVIPVIGGASAGGMTGIITASVINNPIVHITKPSKDLLEEHPENKLYHAWVDLVCAEMFPMLLDTSDIKKGNITSLLNSSFIDKIANKVLRADKNRWLPTPSFFSKNLKVFSTLTNLRGFGYNIAFNAMENSGKYYMNVHNDYACFILEDNDAEGWMPLDFKNDVNTSIAIDAAMATGAFPVGLTSRTLVREAKYLNQSPWCKEITEKFPITTETYESLNIDGGVINNEPFEKVRDVLIDKTKQDNEEEYQDFNKFRSTVLMIDPFPSKKPDEFKADKQIFKVAQKILGSFLDQMRAKPVNLTDAMDVTKAGQFIIAPTRTISKNGENRSFAGDTAIACGSFSGFGGFVSKEFRVHDYFLGRFNCEMFLRNYFTIPLAAAENHEIFKNGYEGVNKELFKAEDGKIQIIPIFSPKPGDHYFPIPKFSNGTNWPTVTNKMVERFRPMIKKRVQALILNAASLSRLNTLLLWIGAKILINRQITNYFMTKIKTSLREHGVLK